MRSEHVDGLVNTTSVTQQDLTSEAEHIKALLDWSVCIEYLDKSNVQNFQNLREKQLVVLGYFFKLCYDICIGGEHNVSNNLGFEAIIGVFKRK